MVDVVPITPLIDPLKELQKKFCLFKLAGTVWVVDLKEIKAVRSGSQQEGVSMYRKEDGRLLMSRHLETLLVRSEPKKVVADFMVSPNTTIYDAIAFNPRPTPPTTLNYWSGSPVTPAKGDWACLKSFLLWVICNGDMGLYRYVVMFLAHMLQKPEEKPGIMIVLLGGQGTGKGTFGELLKAIWPNTTLQVSDVNHVIGQFNANIERNFAICMDEALFAGDRRAMDRLKSFVTEPSVTIEQKHQPRRTIDSFHRFFAASNHAHFAQVDSDDRRFVFLRVSEQYKGDHEYWTATHHAIADPNVISAMVYDLNHYNLARFNVRARPKSQEHSEQKLRSLSGFDRHWYEVLQSGKFGPGIAPDPAGDWDAPCFVSSSNLMAGWREYERGQRSFAARQERDMHGAIRRLCPSAKGGRHKPKYGDQQRGYNLPRLATARDEFEHAVGAKVTWDD